MDQRLKTNKRKAPTVEIPISQPVVRVGAPKIDMTVDTDKFAEALESLAIAINQLGQQQATILREMADTRKQIAELAKNVPKVEVAAPKVTMPSRPRSFDIAFVEEDGEVIGMQVRANLPN